MNQILSAKEYYCLNIPEIDKPWNRKYLNWDFLESEKKRIGKAETWYNHYIKAKEREQLPEINFYVKDVDISAEWKAYIYSIDDFEFKALSTLNNDNQLTFIMLVNRNNVPKDNSYILIKKSKKYIIINRRKETLNALIVEEWEYDETDKIYVDMSYEEDIVAKLLKNTFPDEIIAHSLQSPLMSCPKIINSVGGIGLSSAMNNSTFVLELHKVLQMMLPPDYRTYLPPETFYKGKSLNIARGVNVIFSERPVMCRKVVNTNHSNSINSIDNANIKRRMFDGDEFSFIESITPRTVNPSEIFDELFKKFNQSEITAFYFDELKDYTILTPIRKDINQDIWVNIANARQLKPSIFIEDNKKIQFQKKLEEDWRAVLPEFGFKESLETLPKNKASETMMNAIRFAQSKARSENREIISIDDLNFYRQIVLSNLEEFREHSSVRVAKEYIKKQKEQERFTSIKSYLENEHLTSRELWECLQNSSSFRDFEDMQKLIDWLHKKGYIIKDSQGKYHLV